MTENNADRLHDRTALVLFGSETGNSQDAAELVGRIFERLRFVTKVIEMDGVEINELLQYDLVVVTISTTGQGDIPANGRKFWKSLLRKRLPPGCLRHVKFTTFGLGDSSYVKFNWAARKLHKRLEQLGAHEIYPRGEADEQHEEGIDGAFLPWSLNFRSFLSQSYPLSDGQLPIPESELLPPKWILELVTETSHLSTSAVVVRLSSERLSNMDGPINLPECMQGPSTPDEAEILDDTSPPSTLLPIPFAEEVKVKENSRLTPEGHWQDVRHISLVTQHKIIYEPGDILTIYPKNFPAEVEALIELQDWKDVADLPLVFEKNKESCLSETYMPSLSNIHTTTPATLRSLLIHNLDITAIPRRYFFELISKFTDDDTHRERLQEFTNPAYTDEFFDYATRPRRSMLEVLQDFPSVKLPWRWVTTIFPLLRGRQFSISSGGALKYAGQGTCFNITAAIVKYRTVLRKVRQGVCSRYLTSLKSGSIINITLSQGSLGSLASSHKISRPLLMIAPGTGVAPMRSLIHERAHQRLRFTPEESPPTNVLIFGGRNKAADFFYSEEWGNPALDLHVMPAFSRDQKQKIYVQDLVRDNGKMIWEMLRPKDSVRENESPRTANVWGGSVVVCGSSGRMPISVRAAIVDVFKSSGLTEEVAEAYLAKMEKEGRFMQETW